VRLCRWVAVVSALAFVFVSACSDGAPIGGAGVDERFCPSAMGPRADDKTVAAGGLAGRVFTVVVVNDGSGPHQLQHRGLRLTFGQNGCLAADTSCHNEMTAPYEVDQTRLLVGQALYTGVGCDASELEMRRHALMAAALESNPVFALDGDRLRIAGNGLTVDLLDRKVADPDRPLQGTLWTVQLFLDKDGGGTGHTALATLRFESGQLGVELPGWSTGSTAAAVTGPKVQIEQLRMSDIRCDVAQRKVKNALEALLSGEFMYTIDAETLILRRADGKGLELRSRETPQPVAGPLPDWPPVATTTTTTTPPPPPPPPLPTTAPEPPPSPSTTSRPPSTPWIPPQTTVVDPLTCQTHD
jgi:heat shock protein HslJ